MSSLDADVTSGSLDASNTTLLVVAATVLFAENNLESALRVLHASDELECYALRIQVQSVSYRVAAIIHENICRLFNSE